MANSTAVQSGLELHTYPTVKVSPSKQRKVQRAVAKAQARVLLPFTMGEELKGDEGSLNRFFRANFSERCCRSSQQWWIAPGASPTGMSGLSIQQLCYLWQLLNSFSNNQCNVWSELGVAAAFGL